MALAIGDDDTVVDTRENRQHGDIRIGQALLQGMALDRMIEDGLLSFDRNVIDAEIALCACPHSGDAAVLMRFLCDSNDRIVIE